MSKSQDIFQATLGQISAKTLTLGGKQYLRTRNEKKIKFSEPFSYPPISGPRRIRLLEVQPGSETEILSCKLFEAGLDEKAARFDCLSYTWDLDPTWSNRKFDMVDDQKREERPILVNGKTHHITMNLYNCLDELRRRTWDCPIWADQICINQQDTDEKTAQIAIMTDIYRSASCVIIWLGKLTATRNSALDFMAVLADQPTSLQTTTSGLEKMKIGEGDKDSMFSKISQSWDAVARFGNSVADHWHWMSCFFVIGSRWFNRAWTLQEYLLASNCRLLIGSREISVEQIAKISARIMDFYASDPLATQVGLNTSMLSLKKYLCWRRDMNVEHEAYQRGKRYTAEEYLATMRIRQVTVPKDKVIAGAALMKGGLKPSMDYRATTLDLYLAFAAECLWPEAGISSLSLVGGTKASTEGLPSWAVDLNAPLHPDTLAHCGCPIFPEPTASPITTFRIDGHNLRIRAARWDMIKSTGESSWSWAEYYDDAYNTNGRYRMRTSGSQATERFGMMFALLQEIGSVYTPTHERTIDAFWQTLIGSLHLRSSDSKEAWRTRFQTWFAFTLIDIRSNFHLERNHAGQKMYTFSEAKKWMVPLIADQPSMEARVSAFLDFHDTALPDTAEPDSGVGVQMTLRKLVGTMAMRVWGSETVEQMKTLKGSLAELRSTLSNEAFYEPISKFGEAFETYYDGRRIFLSEKGYLGTGTEDARKGDVLVFVEGARVPFLLRELSGQQNVYTLVGEAYVHGLMDGEVLGKGNLEFEDVVLI